jgi:hypothetical protein
MSSCGLQLTKKPRKGVAQCTLKKTDADESWKSQRLSLDDFPFQRIQIQHQPLSKEYSWFAGELMQNSGGWAEAKIGHAYR